MMNGTAKICKVASKIMEEINKMYLFQLSLMEKLVNLRDINLILEIISPESTTETPTRTSGDENKL